ncbi:hypothetical protein RHECNPAF_1700083 [Rhizobium etli CNPAF512]|nr:hypothetical protein RHECNPAF_1700083 [Rhizobium etli CNPAF512]
MYDAADLSISKVMFVDTIVHFLVGVSSLLLRTPAEITAPTAEQAPGSQGSRELEICDVG